MKTLLLLQDSADRPSPDSGRERRVAVTSGCHYDATAALATDKRRHRHRRRTSARTATSALRRPPTFPVYHHYFRCPAR